MQQYNKFRVNPVLNNRNPHHGIFEFTPLERGFGTTLGNALRRILLGSIPGASMFALRVKGFNHEFQAVEGVKEDLKEVILNLKNVIFSIDEKLIAADELSKIALENWPVLTLKATKKGPLVARDLVLPVGFKVHNPDCLIANITDDKVDFDVDVYVNYGRGYVSFAENSKQLNSISIIATDSSYSPIVKVSYHVEEFKLNRNMLCDKLTLELVTNGSISVSDAIVYAAKILASHLEPLLSLNETISKIEIFREKEEEKKRQSLTIKIEELDLSVRSYNCLKRASIHTTQDLIGYPKQEFEKIRNLGKKSLKEIYQKLKERGLTLKE